MTRKNRYYPPESKREALAMLATGEYTMAELERELGITAGLEKQWKRQVERNGEYVSPNSEQTKALTPIGIGCSITFRLSMPLRP